jgi:hypothetical protein
MYCARGKIKHVHGKIFYIKEIICIILHGFFLDVPDWLIIEG